MNWDDVIKKAAPYVVKIETPAGSGTGYLCTYNDSKSFCIVATALHVIADADAWQQPIRIHNHDFTKTTFLKEDDRVVFRNAKNDSAVILFSPQELGLPETPIPLRPIDAPLSIGAEIGWLGFPGIEPNTLCFFSGNVSARREDRRVYFIDGVAINGVSGGPVLYSSQTDGVQFIGVVSAYRANRLTGETLPGLLVAQDVSHFHEVISKIRSMDEASKKRAELEATQSTQQTKDAEPVPEPVGKSATPNEGTASFRPL